MGKYGYWTAKKVSNGDLVNLVYTDGHLPANSAFNHYHVDRAEVLNAKEKVFVENGLGGVVDFGIKVKYLNSDREHDAMTIPYRYLEEIQVITYVEEVVKKEVVTNL